MTFEALFGGIRDQWFCWITSRPGLEAPASRRGILLLVLQHDGGHLPWTFHVGAIGDGEVVQIGQQHGLVRIWFAFVERGLSDRIDINVVHSAHCLKERAAFVDDHRVDVVPVTEARWELENVGRLRGEGGDEAHNSRGQQAQPSAPLEPPPPSAISDSIVGADAHPDAAHGASPVISTVGIVWPVTLVLARFCPRRSSGVIHVLEPQRSNGRAAVSAVSGGSGGRCIFSSYMSVPK